MNYASMLFLCLEYDAVKENLQGIMIKQILKNFNVPVCSDTLSALL